MHRSGRLVLRVAFLIALCAWGMVALGTVAQAEAPAEAGPAPRAAQTPPAVRPPLPLLWPEQAREIGADLAVTQSDAADPVDYGQPVVYALSVRHTSDETLAQGVTLTDTLDANVAYLSCAGAPCRYDAAAHHVLFDLGALAPGAAADLTVTAQVLPSAPAMGLGGRGAPGAGCLGDLRNIAAVGARTADPDLLDNAYCEPTGVQSTLAIACPANVALSCDASREPEATGYPTATTTCQAGAPAYRYQDTSVGLCHTTVMRVWSAVDACGNEAECVQLLTVDDTTPPTLEGVPADATAACGEVSPPPAVTATDSCDADVPVTLSELYSGGPCPYSFTLVRTWTAVDDCGNRATASQTITVVDDQGPVLLGVPDDLTVACDAIPAPAQPTARDNCSPEAPIAYEERVEPGSCAGSYALVRTWTATDACGNRTVESQTITVVDTDAPVFSQPAQPEAPLPADLTVSCDAVPAPAVLTASDDCAAAVPVLFSETRGDGTCADGYTLTRTWTAADDCGHESRWVQRITVVDHDAPALSGVPGDVTAACDAVPAPAQPAAVDTCDEQVELAFTEQRVEEICPGAYRLLRAWTATDDCGNSATASQAVTVVDTEAPVFNEALPPDQTVSCDAVPAPVTLTARDGCDAEVPVAFSETRQSGACANEYVLTRTWTAADDCGNRAAWTQVVTVVDTQAPALALPADRVVECDAPTGPDATGWATATDGCDGDPRVEYSDVERAGDCAHERVIERAWTATDACGNTTRGVQTITVADRVAPAFVLPAELEALPADETVSCDAVPAAPVLAATDQCDSDVPVLYSETRAEGSCSSGQPCCPQSYTLTRVWTATDDCGNETRHAQTITVRDTTAPALAGVPGDVTVSCDAIPAPAQPTARDDCDAGVAIAYTEQRQPGDCASGYALVRTWTATDACGNSASASQTITVVDTEAPLLSAPPADITVSCDEIPAVATLTASDNCDAQVAISYGEWLEGGSCPDGYTIVRIWTATDDCGNSTHATQTITVVDTAPPAFVEAVPPDSEASCDAVPPAAALTASDTCAADVPVSFSEERIPGTCASQYTLVRAWTAADDCGNAVSARQTVTVVDTEAPVFDVPPELGTLPPDQTVSCDAVPAPVTLTARDGCDAEVPVAFSETRQSGACINEYVLTRTWTAADDCGNRVGWTQVVTVVDTQAPALALPADRVVECDAPTGPDATGWATATDGCDGDPRVEYSDVEQAGDCAHERVIERAWTATDACGNTTRGVQTITVADRVAPAFVLPAGLEALPADETVSCDAVPAAPVLAATDQCDSDVPVLYSETRAEGSCPSGQPCCPQSYTLTRVWTATDDCGNETRHAQTITVRDTTAPALAGVPEDVTVSCDAIPAPAQPTARDDCDAGVAIAYTEERRPGDCASGYQIVRTWTATDACGNSASASQTITVVDTEAPLLSAPPADVAVSCDDIPAPAVLTATDNCDPAVAIAYAETRMAGSCAGTYALLRTWTATDDCGNSTAATQTITVTDDQAPAFDVPPELGTLPPDIMASCDAVPPPAALTARDDCDADVPVLFSEERSAGTCASGYTLTRTWTAADDCGNETRWAQTVTVVDTAAPVFQAPPELGTLPQDATVSCDALPPAPTLRALDSCSGETPVTFSETRRGASCATGYTLVRTWTTADPCGNRAEWVQTLRVLDTQPPALTIPADREIECDRGQAAATDPAATGWAAAADACDEAPLITYSDVERAGECVQSATIERTWTAVDACGNAVSAVQVIRLVDRTPPAFAEPLPGDETASCDGVSPPAILSAADRCDEYVPVVYAETRSGETCADGFTLTRTWTATDDCGNVARHAQTVTISDTQAPAVTCPANVVIANEADRCGATVRFAGSAEDNCSSVVLRYVTAQATITSPHQFPVGVNVVEGVAADECGNEGRCAFTVTVNDVDAPSITCAEDIVQDTDPGACEARVSVTPPQASDNCGPPQVTGTRSDGRALTDPYPLGATTIAWAAADGQGHRVTCSQHVLVADMAPTVLRVAKSGPAVAADGDKVVYHFVVTNDPAAGDGSPLADVAVTDDLAGAAAYAIGDDGDGYLEVGETWEFRGEYVVRPTDPLVLANQVEATGRDCDGDRVSARAVSTLEVARAALADPQDWNDPQCAGADQRYTLVFSNTGAVALEDVLLTVWIPTTVSFNEPASSEGLIVSGPQHGRWKIARVAPGQAVTRHLQIHVKRQLAGQELAACFTLDAERIDPLEKCVQSRVTSCAAAAVETGAATPAPTATPPTPTGEVTPAPTATPPPPPPPGDATPTPVPRPAETLDREVPPRPPRPTPGLDATSIPPPLGERTPAPRPV